jgi:Zn-dependent peptidase ImmA (M78 family)
VARRPNRAEQAAADLLDSLGIDIVPVPVAKIAKELGVILQYEPLEGGMSGVLFRGEADRPVMGINELHADVRQRFTIAHELGHLQLHKDALYVDGLVRRDAESSLALNSQEIEANAFAAELLMPRKLVLQEITKRVPEGGVAEAAKLVRQMAKSFEVSEQAMEFRLVNLGLATSF